MQAAWDCRKHDLTSEQAITAIRSTEGMLRDGRRFQRGEIEDAVEKAFSCDRLQCRDINPKLTWPQWSPDKTREIHSELGLEPADLWERSEIRIEEQTAEDFVDTLFGEGNPLLCCGWSMARFDTRPREEWRGELDGMQLVVPAIMTSRTGTTKDGKESTHTLQNTGPRLYMVVDLDDPPPEEHSSILWHLAEFAPLALVLRSGGKGLHGWYRVNNTRLVHDFYRYACLYGADPVLHRNPSQFVRLPHGLRENGSRQSVLYLNLRNLSK